MQIFKQELSQHIESRQIIDDPLLCYAYGTDASLYRLTPQLVILISNDAEVLLLLKLAAQHKIGLTFRAAGTSLSGQAVTNQVLVVLDNRSWQKYSIYNNGWQIILEPGIIGAKANLLLKPYQTKIGPDPASIHTCKIGGIVANNSSGMCCGINKNTYHTLSSIKIILANGAVLDTKDPTSKEHFIANNQHIIRGINQLRQQIIANPTLSKFIQHKFKIKNTSGYSLNSFIDFTNPIDILAHLMVGSEGTLGFISEVGYNCVANNPYKAVTLVYCDKLADLINLTLKLTQTNHSIDAIELLDITSLNSIKNNITAQAYLPLLTLDTAAMLIELSADNQPELDLKIIQLQQIIASHNTSFQIKFTQDSKIYTELWALRQGILPAIGGDRPLGTNVVLEDIAVAITVLPQLIYDLRQLFTEFSYTNAAIFGHILAGNIHFVFTPKFDTTADIDNYKKFMDKMCYLVTHKYHGSLKAEHGCGRNMAPFVELEWGSQLYSIMWQIKNLLDPQNILNPDVKLTHNANLHIENLKQLNPAHSEIDKCIECGYCETVCPSQNLTLTPRQRIAVYRKISVLKSYRIDKAQYKQFSKSYQYYGIKTCATTGLCKTKCPVGINTGDFILSLKTPPLLQQYWYRHFAVLVKLNKYFLHLGNLAARCIGSRAIYRATQKINRIIPITPVYLPTLPLIQTAQFINLTTYPSRSSSSKVNNVKYIVYFPSCNNRILGDTLNRGNKNTALQQLITYLGYTIIYPDDLPNLCCGQLFNSQGNSNLALDKATQLLTTLTRLNYP
ncbi:MAG: FAD-binding oxidoreductase, partial [Burkholderiales bacterium]|nr:FAD-binding oxidoreductase [Burkholderiales bacterium]